MLARSEGLVKYFWGSPARRRPDPQPGAGEAASPAAHRPTQPAHPGQAAALAPHPGQEQADDLLAYRLLGFHRGRTDMGRGDHPRMPGQG